MIKGLIKEFKVGWEMFEISDYLFYNDTLLFSMTCRANLTLSRFFYVLRLFLDQNLIWKKVSYFP